MMVIFHSTNTRDTAFYGCDEIITKADILDAVDNNSDLYDMAAIVDTDTLGKAYDLTQNIDKLWTENKEVDCHTDRPRSTMVGDVIIAPDGVYVVASFGFDKLKSLQQ